ncbi:MAG TPA: DUF1269 domain-containing protein [Terriglobia bacterium]|nr:DUF1269 domain-containing protein [Terriglobia bacterium]
MDRMLVVIFDRESQAFEGKKALIQLEHAGDIVIYDCAVVARNADGTATVRQSDDPRPVGTLVGTTLGALFGLLGGPAGAAVGAAAGLAVGASVDVDHARVGDDFVEDVREKLLPEKFALMAEIQEDWTDPVDTPMEALGGTVFRRALSEVKHKVHEENTAAMKADRAQMKAEHAQAHADRKAKLQEKINQLDSKIQAQLEKSKQRRQAAEAEEKAKVEFLKARAAAMKAKAPDRQD